MPPLTRHSTKGKFRGVFQKTEKPEMTQRRKAHVRTTYGDCSFNAPHLCFVINTMQRVGMDFKVLQKRIVANLNSSNSTNEDDIANGASFKFSTAAAVEGIRQLRECIAYNVVFQDLSRSLDGLYLGEASFVRIEPFLDKVEQYLRDHIINKAR